jgi:putative phosphoribosyl transferase
MIIDIPGLRDKLYVFKDRLDAGYRLAGLLGAYRGSQVIVLALPAGGVPVAAGLAEKLKLPLDVAVVSKITLPWNSEVGFGAVAFDGTVRFNDLLLADVGLNNEQIEQRTKLTKEKVAGRLKIFRRDRPPLDLKNRTCILVDDGVASGMTMATAVEAIKKLAAKQIFIAVPTGHRESLSRLEKAVDKIFCANVRSGFSFAVADAYKNWSDVDDNQVAEILTRHNKQANI